MSALDVQAEILGPMQRLFLPPRQMPANDQEAALREYVAALQIFDATELNTAWCAVRDAHTTRSWPLPSAFINAAREARRYSKSLTTKSPQAKNGRPTSAESWEVWKGVSRSALARDAVRMNVAWALKCAIVNDEKLPSQIDLRELRLAKSSAERLAEAIKTGGSPIADSLRASALNMWKILLQREEETQREINYGVTA